MNTEQERIDRANKWLAEKLDIKAGDNPLLPDCNWKHGDSVHYGVWDIRKADCREIVREEFKLSTMSGRYTTDEYPWGCGDEDSKLVGYGKTIDEAEIQCILSIVEQEEG